MIPLLCQPSFEFFPSQKRQCEYCRKSIDTTQTLPRPSHPIRGGITSIAPSRDLSPQRSNAVQPYPHVALFIETSKRYGRELIRGIGRYVSAHEPWSVYLTEREETNSEPDWLRTWNGSGIITRSENPVLAHEAMQRGIPVVNLGYWGNIPDDLKMPCVNCDHHATGQIVAEHFLHRGFKNFAYCGVKGPAWSEDRRDSFRDILSENKIVLHLFEEDATFGDPMEEDWEPAQEQLGKWLVSLPKPVSIMAAYDVLGARVLDACQRAKIRVPEEVALVGVDNDPLFCSLTSPPMSSVDQNVERIGFEAAKLLNQMMEEKDQPAEPNLVLIQPQGIATRISSETTAVDDPHVANALQFIRQQSNHPISVDEVATQVHLSRRELERRFRKSLAISPYKEIQRARIKRVTTMLLNTDYTLETISEILEFSEAANMAALFKKITGSSPGDFRRANRQRGPVT